MNKFKKYCPNVWVAECEEQYEKGEIIILETQYGKEVECEVYNLIAEKNGIFYYSIVRLENQTYAERKAERYKKAVENHNYKSNQYYESAQESREFLALGEPVKVGHHSEKRHRALLERNANRMYKCIEYQNKAEESQKRADYWEMRANDITLAMPESLEYYEHKLEQVKERQKGLKDGTIKREHSYSLAYATKDVKELTKKLETAKLLWE